MPIGTDLFGKEVKPSTSSPVLPGAIEEMDLDKTGGRKMIAVAVPEEYLGLVTSLITERESAQHKLFEC